MSRYSRIFLRQKDANFTSELWTASSSSKMSTVEPHSTTSPGYSYPPSTSLPSRDADFSMMTPPAHPYTLGATHSPVEISFRDGPAISKLDQQNASQFNNEKQGPENVTGFQYSQPTRRQASRRISTISLQRPLPLPLHLRPVFVFLLYLPFPPLLSMIYMVTGHAILRQTHPSPSSVYQAPLLSSLEAGATGGIILAVPLALLLYLLLSPNKPSAEPEDFFEDDNSSDVTRERWLRYAGVVVCAFFVVCIGGVAGPLGVTCLSNGSLDTFVGSRKLLSSSSAAAAGFLGGVLIDFGILLLAALGTGGMLWMRNSRSPSS